jgi:hypothetical protein
VVGGMIHPSIHPSIHPYADEDENEKVKDAGAVCFIQNIYIR